jgi:hypothetical protein
MPGAPNANNNSPRPSHPQSKTAASSPRRIRCGYYCGVFICSL